MGRHPIGERALTNAEKHRRYMARLRQRAAQSPAPAPNKPQSFVAADAITIRVGNLRMPGAADWLCRKLDQLGGHAEAFGEDYARALATLRQESAAQAIADPTEGDEPEPIGGASAPPKRTGRRDG